MCSKWTGWEMWLLLALFAFALSVASVKSQELEPQKSYVAPPVPVERPGAIGVDLPPPPGLLPEPSVPETVVVTTHSVPASGSLPLEVNPQDLPPLENSDVPCEGESTSQRRWFGQGRWFSRFRGGCGACDGGCQQGMFPRLRAACQGCKGKGKECLNQFGLGCHAHHDQYGCSSLWSELRFAFGSCRAFFGEPCRPGPLRVPVPPGSNPPPPPPLLPYQGGGHQAYGYQHHPGASYSGNHSAYRHPLQQQQ